MVELPAQRKFMVRIRNGRPDDFSRLAEIELDAFVVWAEACGVEIEPSTAPDDLLHESLDHGLLLVAEDVAGRAIGFAMGQTKHGYLYVVEVDVERAAQCKGIGRSLMLAILDKGRELGLKHAVLTTDRYAPFNAPFYTRLGFDILSGSQTPDFLQERLEAQIASGLDAERRVAMQVSL